MLPPSAATVTPARAARKPPGSPILRRMLRRLTLGQVFYLSIVALAILLGVLLYVLSEGSRRAVIESSARLRASASQQVEARVDAYLAQAEAAVAELERRLRDGGCPAGDLAAVESCLFATATANPNLSEVT